MVERKKVVWDTVKDRIKLNLMEVSMKKSKLHQIVGVLVGEGRSDLAEIVAGEMPPQFLDNIKKKKKNKDKGDKDKE